MPDDVRESATGLGYGPGRLLFGIELPLALPVIMAGLRVATVSTVALVTVGSLVAYGGLGNLIKDGVSTNFRAELLTAAVLCVVLAVLLDLILVGGPEAADAVDPGGHDVTVFGDTWSYLSDGANWSGNAGHAAPARPAAAAHGDRAGRRRADRPAGRAVAGPPRPGRLPRHQHLQRRPRGADLRAARHPGDPDCPGTAELRTLRPGRPGDADRADPVRAAADHHQRLRRRPRGRPRTSRSPRAAWG